MQRLSGAKSTKASKQQVSQHSGTASSAAADRAWRRFGKGRHVAGLNLGDCFAYALARITGEPLLFKGADFANTDIAAVRY